jgi:outer membrane protein OmpA-like peptidoglycan-associated protein
MKISRLAIVLLPALAPGLAHAKPFELELGGGLGGHAFSENGELGVSDSMLDASPLSAVALAMRVGYPILERLAVEGEAVYIPTEDDRINESANVFALRTHVRFDALTGRLRPFVVGGIGFHVLSTTSSEMNDDTDKAWHWGGGLRFRFTNALEGRFDLRHLIVPDRTLDGATSDFEFTAGVTYRLGAAKTRRASSAGRDLDRDHDGFADQIDRCPNEPEIINSWRDDDGCPDAIIEELNGIQFEWDSANIDPASAPILDRAYQILINNSSLTIEISGHTSTDGDPGRNVELSYQRADAVEAELVRRGIPEYRILTVGHGSLKPIADNTTEDGRRKNRRIEFRILRPGEKRQ